MVTKVKILKLYEGLSLSQEVLEHLYREISFKINDITLNDINSNFYFSNELDKQHYLMLKILHRLKAPLERYQKHFRFLNLTNPYNYHYNVWASLCLAERDSSDFNVDYSLMLMKMYNTVIHSYMHRLEEQQRDSYRLEYLSGSDLENCNWDWGGQSFGDWGNIEGIKSNEESTWSSAYINYSLFWHEHGRFDDEKLPEEIHYALVGEINWKENDSILKELEKIGLILSSEKKLTFLDEFMHRNHNETKILMTAFLLLLETNDISNLKKVVMALSNNLSFSANFQSLKNIFYILEVFQEKSLSFDFLDIYNLLYNNANNIKELNNMFKIEELGKLMLNGLLSFDSKSKTSVFNLVNGKSFSYTWVLNDYNHIKSDNSESDNTVWSF